MAQRDLARYVRVTEKHLARGKDDYQRVFTARRLPAEGRVISRRGSVHETPEAVLMAEEKRKTITL